MGDLNQANVESNIAFSDVDGNVKDAEDVLDDPNQALTAAETLPEIKSKPDITSEPDSSGNDDQIVFLEGDGDNDSSGRGNDEQIEFSTTGMNVLAEIRSNPQKFISEVQNLDPVALRHIINLLEDLLANSEAREAHLDADLENKKAALSGADGDVVDAEDVLDDANQAVADAQTVVGEKEDLVTQAEGAVAAAQGVLGEKQGDVTAAESDLAAKKEVHKTKKAEKEASEEAHNAEVPDLNDEQSVLRDVIAILEDLHGRQGSQPTAAPTQAPAVLPSHIHNCGGGWYSKTSGSRVNAVQTCKDQGYFGTISQWGGNSGVQCRHTNDRNGGSLTDFGHTVSWKCEA